MVKKENKPKPNYYKKLKGENEELKKKVGWLEEDAWILGEHPKIEQVYHYLKDNPESALFIYNKYPEHQKVIKELCDPLNPLYLVDVAKELEGIVVIESNEDKLKRIREEKNNILEEIRKSKDEEYKLKSEIKEKEKEWEEWHTKLEDINKRKDEMDRQVGNLEEPEVLKKIKSFNESFKALYNSIFNNKKPENIQDYMLGVITLTPDQKNTLKLLNDQAEEIKKLINDNDFLTDYKFNEIRENLRKQIEAEKENAQNEMNAFMAHNPQKLISAIDDSLNTAKHHFNNGDITGNTVSFGRTGQIQVLTNLDEALKYLGLLNTQVKNKSVWSKIKAK